MQEVLGLGLVPIELVWQSIDGAIAALRNSWELKSSRESSWS